MRKNTEKYFDFIEDQKIKNQLSQDLNEMHECMRKSLNKASMVMIGSLIECVLYYHIANTEEIKSKIPGFEKREIKLYDLLKWAREFGVISDGLYKLSDPIRDYRNMIHPRVQERTQADLSEQLVQIGYNVFLEIIRNLNQHHGALKDGRAKSIISKKVKDFCDRSANASDFQVYIPVLEKYGLIKGSLIIERSLQSSRVK